ncbi:2-amino-4-hydroxy-6-hydroxymethyldihydropteridine diphosphokinase [Flavihumibacter fluvii]|uniref:2-amino-4-hydroxy-6- hydroxymethyldihydropteridine diphosphokinase n=1 Tax=Flavihumibacter fluvii TaxID=2838157 RepID=UPI001BDE0AAF|nr:2-amino-4-hydroxy-6-hydroxymethyldihydropteridine diphosphokinase [Flavihumibacter fluvii]ULQ53703.1 2-amino-4-hydroxy-6-hydroxymethyldihydropteridine diphosphokinase [Flavihumibacter fluvii]
MHTAYLLIGGNLGNRLEYLQQAVSLINRQAGKATAISSVYETSAWGKTDQPPFLNQVMSIHTKLSAAELMTNLLSIEQQIGRQRADRYGPRIIDLDILFFDAEIHQSPHITIPHPEIAKRRFALVPMAELAPELVHPILLKSIAKLLEECKDPLAVKKI